MNRTRVATQRRDLHWNFSTGGLLVNRRGFFGALEYNPTPEQSEFHTVDVTSKELFDAAEISDEMLDDFLQSLFGPKNGEDVT